MKTAYFDCFSGISGNMFIGAFLDAGIPLEELTNVLAGLNLYDEYELVSKRVQKLGIAAHYFDVKIGPHHHHVHQAGHGNRHYREIAGLIENSALAPNVKDLSLRILKRLGEAEARVHNCSLEEVHFHEVGAVDTIIDIVGSAYCLLRLGIEQIFASPLHVGKGMVKCAHGLMPIPAPATAELLKGAHFYSTEIQGELVTPTGAAIITTLAQDFRPLPSMQVDTVAYGAGTWDLSIPNVLRLFIGQDQASSLETDTSTIIETTLDDMNPEFYGYLLDKLYLAGAVDVYLTPIYMKKNRPGTLVTITSNLPDHQPLVDVIFSETTTLGVRMYPAKRCKLFKESHTLETVYGQVRVKIGRTGNQLKNVSPEYEDCRQLALKTGVPLKHIYQAALAKGYELFSK